jgi:hypothetical protein
MNKIALASLSLLLAACGATPQSSPRPLEEPVISSPRTPESARQPTASATASVLIQGRSNKAILDAIQQNRTRRGMKLMSRNAYRIQFSQTLPGATPPTEVRMIYQLNPEGPHLRLSAQVLRISNPGRANEIITDISQELAGKIRDELESYAR